MSKRLAIVFRDLLGNAIVPNQNSPGHPYVEIVFRNDPHHGSSLGRVVSNYTIVHALIDTGADYVYANPSLIAQHNCPRSSISGTTGTASGSSPMIGYTGHIFLPTLGVQTQCDVLALPAERPFAPVVLGNSYLMFGKLNLDYLNNDFWFELP